MNKEQYQKLKSALLVLKDLNNEYSNKRTLNLKFRNFTCDYIQGFEDFKDFNACYTNIILEIGGL